MLAPAMQIGIAVGINGNAECGSAIIRRQGCLETHTGRRGSNADIAAAEETHPLYAVGAEGKRLIITRANKLRGGIGSGVAAEKPCEGIEDIGGEFVRRDAP